LVIGLGVAVAFAAFMAGWFVLTVVSGDSGSTEVREQLHNQSGYRMGLRVRRWRRHT
jgi:hypothetical protein